MKKRGRFDDTCNTWQGIMIMLVILASDDQANMLVQTPTNFIKSKNRINVQKEEFCCWSADAHQFLCSNRPKSLSLINHDFVNINKYHNLQRGSQLKQNMLKFNLSG